MSVYAWTVAPLIVIHLSLWRRRPAVFRFQLLLDVILAVVVGPALVVGGDLNPVQTLKGTPPFRNVEWSPVTGFQPTQGDLVFQFHPWWDEAGRQLRRFELPRIQPGVGGGLPLLANGQTGLWAPVMLPVWVLGPERGTTVMALWKLELAGLGAFLLMQKAWRLRWAVAAVAGIGWAGTPYLVGWLLVPLAWAAAALPWAWWAAWWIGRRRTTLRGAGLVGLGFGWLMGAGLHPETASIVCGSALLSVLICHPKRWFRVVVAVAVAGLTALVFAWPTIGYIAASSRVELGADGAANREGLPASVQRDLARQIVVPAVVGHPARGDWRPSYPHAPGAAGVGGALLALLVSGRTRPRYFGLAGAAGVSTALGLILLLRLSPLDALLVRIPPLDHMTLPRFGVLIPWGLVALASLALDGALQGRRLPVAVRLGPAAIVAVVALFSTPWILAPFDAGLVGLSVTMAFVVALSSWLRVVPGLVAVELALLAVAINPVASVTDRLPRPPLVAKLTNLAAEKKCRIIGTNRALAPNLASRYELRDLRASDPLRPAPVARLMGVFGEPPAFLDGPLSFLPAGLCGAWGVGLAVTPPGHQLAGWRCEYRERDGAIWSNPLLLPEVRVAGRVIEENDEALDLLEFADGGDFGTTVLVGPGAEVVNADVVALELRRRSPTFIEASTECDGPCLVVVAQPWAPGWRAVVDDEPAPIVRTNIAGLGVVSPAGRHTVRFEYRPWAWWGGVP